MSLTPGFRGGGDLELGEASTLAQLGFAGRGPFLIL